MRVSSRVWRWLDCVTSIAETLRLRVAMSTTRIARVGSDRCGDSGWHQRSSLTPKCRLPNYAQLPQTTNAQSAGKLLEPRAQPNDWAAPDRSICPQRSAWLAVCAGTRGGPRQRRSYGGGVLPPRKRVAPVTTRPWLLPNSVTFWD